MSPTTTTKRNSRTWDDRFSELMAYKAKTGSICVSFKHSKSLQDWTNTQRNIFKEGNLCRDRQKKLEAIGFDFLPQRERRSWDDNFSKLMDYKAKTGNCHVPSKQKVLQAWGNNQRRLFKEGRLSIDRIKKLERIGFNFDFIPEHNWNDNFSKLVAYKAKNGSFHVSSQHSKVLQAWVNHQRTRFKEGSLSIDRIKKLEAIGFDFSPQSTVPHLEHSWDDRFAELVAHKGETGSCHVSTEHKFLNKWVNNQRQRFKEGSLSRDRVEKLEGIGFDFGPQRLFMSRPNDMLSLLRDFRGEFGHVCVPYKYEIVYDGRPVRLGNWVCEMRHKRRRGMIDEGLKHNLDSMGFVWNPRKAPQRQYPTPPPPRPNSRHHRQQESHQIGTDDDNNNNTEISWKNNMASWTSEDNSAPTTPAAATTTTLIDSPPPRTIMQKIFWRPPTPYPMSDDDEDCCLGS